jgi:hypothetical protein
MTHLFVPPGSRHWRTRQVDLALPTRGLPGAPWAVAAHGPIVQGMAEHRAVTITIDGNTEAVAVATSQRGRGAACR